MQASSAAVHNQIASQYAPADDLPCADFTLLVPLKKSPEYRTIRPRIANPLAADSWQEEGLHFFVFALTAADGPAYNVFDPPVVVFTLHPEEPVPISVVVVTPKDNGAAEVMDLRQPNNTYIAPLLVATISAQHQDTPEQQGHVFAPSTTADEPITIEHLQDSRAAFAHVEVVPPAELDNSADASQVDIVEGVAAANSLTHAEQSDLVEATNGSAPEVNVELLAALKELPEYQALQHRGADREPIDAWQEEGLHFFVFQFREGDAATIDPTEAPAAVFTMNAEFNELVAAVIVTPGRNGEADETTDLRRNERGSTSPV